MKDKEPTIVFIDEFPYILASPGTFMKPNKKEKDPFKKFTCVWVEQNTDLKDFFSEKQEKGVVTRDEVFDLFGKEIKPIQEHFLNELNVIATKIGIVCGFTERQQIKEFLFFSEILNELKIKVKKIE